MTNYVLGLDPGLAKCGYALVRVTAGSERREVVALGTLVTKKAAGNVAADNVRRCSFVARELRKLANTGPLGVRAILAESMSHPRSASAAAKVTLVWGALIDIAVQKRLVLLHMSPQQVKKAVVGTIDASKVHVERVLVRRYGRQIKRLLDGVPRGLHEHAYDALASATACLEHPAWQRQLAQVHLV